MSKASDKNLYNVDRIIEKSNIMEKLNKYINKDTWNKNLKWNFGRTFSDFSYSYEVKLFTEGGFPEKHIEIRFKNGSLDIEIVMFSIPAENSKSRNFIRLNYECLNVLNEFINLLKIEFKIYEKKCFDCEHAHILKSKKSRDSGMCIYSTEPFLEDRKRNFCKYYDRETKKKCYLVSFRKHLICSVLI